MSYRISASRPSILCLIAQGRPLAILRGVSLVVIDPLQGEPRRASTHVEVKGYEVIFPSVANRDAATAVVFIILVRRSAAPILHVHPSLIFAAPFASPVLSVLRASNRGSLFPQTAATYDFTLSQIITSNHSPSPAIAFDDPDRRAGTAIPRFAKNEEATVPVPGYVDIPDHQLPPRRLTSVMLTPSFSVIPKPL